MRERLMKILSPPSTAAWVSAVRVDSADDAGTAHSGPPPRQPSSTGRMRGTHRLGKRIIPIVYHTSSRSGRGACPRERPRGTLRELSCAWLRSDELDAAG